LLFQGYRNAEFLPLDRKDQPGNAVLIFIGINLDTYFFHVILNIGWLFSISRKDAKVQRRQARDYT
jgi:hypothetical protein